MTPLSVRQRRYIRGRLREVCIAKAKSVYGRTFDADSSHRLAMAVRNLSDPGLVRFAAEMYGPRLIGSLIAQVRAGDYRKSATWRYLGRSRGVLGARV